MNPCSKILSCYILLFFALLACHCWKQNVIINDSDIKLSLEPSPDNPRNSEGDFIKLADGRLLYIYTHFTGGKSDHASAYLAGRFSSDGGNTWTLTDSIIVPNEGQMNVMSVSLLRLQNGNIALFYLRKNSKSDCIPIVRISTDEAKSWSAPQKCIDKVGYYVLNNDCAVQLKNGRIMLPVSLHLSQDGEFNEHGLISCYFSDDSGETWSESAHVPNPDSVVLQEPGIIELKNGRLMIFCRTTSGSQYLSYSNDMGNSWSPVQPSSIKSPRSPASIERIPATGDLFMVWNNSYDSTKKNGGNRTPLNCAVSRDDGKTWEHIKTLENDPDGWYCYTAIEFVNNDVLLSYCAGNRKEGKGLSMTHITRLNVDKIYK